jgi:hypothetical protein
MFNAGPPFYRTPDATTTKKHNTFMSTPLQDCHLSDVPGAGDVACAKLIEAGVCTPEQLMGHFLISNRNHSTMTQWLVASGVRAQEAAKIATALDRKGRATVAV